MTKCITCISLEVTYLLHLQRRLYGVMPCSCTLIIDSMRFSSSLCVPVCQGTKLAVGYAAMMQKPDGFNSNRRSQNINKICFSHQVLLPALGWGTCRLPPHFQTRHVPRVRLADAARAASFTIFFEFGFLFFLRSTLDRIRLPQCGASVTTCFVAHAEAFPISARFIRTHRSRPA